MTNVTQPRIHGARVGVGDRLRHDEVAPSPRSGCVSTPGGGRRVIAHVEVARAVRHRVPAGVTRALARKLRRAGRRLQPGHAPLPWTVRLCDDTEIAALHVQHMGERGPTDVLSFPGGAPVPGQDQVELGDIVISWDAVLRQCRGTGVEVWLEEVTQLAMHGLAHLVGHDHGTRAQARAMLRAERRAARAAGAAVPMRAYG